MLGEAPEECRFLTGGSGWVRATTERFIITRLHQKMATFVSQPMSLNEGKKKRKLTRKCRQLVTQTAEHAAEPAVAGCSGNSLKA